MGTPPRKSQKKTEKQLPRTPSEENGTQYTLTEWPKQPAQNRCKPYDLLLNTLSVLIGLLLVVYIVLLIASNGRPTKYMPGIVSFLHEFSNLSPTAMPIIFAFVVGRTIKTIAHWRLQQGERIGLLDLLYGSTTVIDTISTMFDAGEFGFTPLILVLTWALSPVGSQSALRVFSLQASSEISSSNFLYYNSSTPLPNAYMAASLGSLVSPAIAQFLTSLGAPNSTTQSSLDTWGNVKVPMIEKLPGYKGPDSKEWVTVDTTANGSSAPVYSSFIGIPVAAVPSDRNSSFSVEASYMNLYCDKLERVYDNQTDEVNAKIQKLAPPDCELGPSVSGLCNRTMSWGRVGTIPYPGGNVNTSSQVRCSDPNPSARELLYFNVEQLGGTYTRCSLNTTYVEMAVDCVGWECVSTAIRPSQRKGNPSSNHTFFDGTCEPGSVYTFWWYMTILDMITSSFRVKGSPARSAIQAYIINPYTALNATAMLSQADAWTLDKSVFSVRLAQVLNSFWISAVATEAVFLGHPLNYDSLRTNIMYEMLTSNSNATIASPVTRVHCDYRWMVPLILSTVLLLIAAVVTMVLDLELRVPKMLMNITTLTRGQHETFFLPPGGGGLTDETRAKLIRDLRVRFGEMEDKEQDDLGVGVCAEEGGTVSIVNKKRPLSVNGN